MKRKIIKVAFVAAFALVAGYGVYVSQNKEELSGLALANVEALASGESSGGGFTITCGSKGGQCWTAYRDCSISWFTRYEDCIFSGYMSNSCYTPCN